MRKVIFTTALCLSAMTQLMAQNITGKVVDTKGEPLAFANVVLLNRTGHYQDGRRQQDARRSSREIIPA